MAELTKEEAKLHVGKLIEKYQRISQAGKINSYNEAQTRNEFIEPLFESLGWDMRNLSFDNEVTTEETVSGGRVDLAFRFNNLPVLFLEAKSMKVDLDEWKWAEQAINYSWNKSVTWAVLTDFESVKVFNAEIPPKSVSQNLFIEIPCRDFLNRFDQLWLLSKNSFEERLLDKEAQKWGKLTLRKQVGDKLFEDLMTWRVALTADFKKHNQLTEEELNEGVQRILDRLIFIRTAEDRKLEPSTLLGLYRTKSTDLYPRLVQLFRDFDDGYNSKLFAPHYCETWKAGDKAWGEIITGLYETKDGYRYDFSAISADVLGGIYEQYLSFVQAKSKTADKKGSKRKSQGIYYTPKYVVEYIVKETLGEVLKKTKPKDIYNLKVLDPACGSGSFLTAAYDKILTNIDKPSLFAKFDALKGNIYGVDLDAQAVEIAQLNLLLKVLSQKTKLPTLQHNLRVGNSLISEGDEKFNPLNFTTNFKEVFSSTESRSKTTDRTGFDVIIGNPPYGAELSEEENTLFKRIYDIGSTDTAILFIKKAFDLLQKKGRMGFIVPKAFCYASNWEKVREYIWDHIETIIDCGKAWKDVKLEQVIFILDKGKKTKSYTSGRFENENLEILGTIDKAEAKEFGFLLNGVSEREVAVAKKIKASSISLNAISTNRRGALLQKFVSEQGDFSVIGGAQVQRFGITGTKGRIDSKNVHDEQARIQNRSLLVQNIVAHIANPVDHIKITACIPQNKDLVIADTVNQIIPQPDVDPFAIWALLNSKLMNWYAYRFIFGKAIRTMHFDNGVTDRIPIPKNISKVQATLVDLAQKMMAVGHDLQTVSPKTDRYIDMQNKIRDLGDGIDREVYRLYGLNPVEIETIENI